MVSSIFLVALFFGFLTGLIIGFISSLWSWSLNERWLENERAAIRRERQSLGQVTAGPYRGDGDHEVRSKNNGATAFRAL